jgi:flagellar protein FliO/FliZ
MIGLLGRLVMAMTVVLVVMVLAAKVARNRNFGGVRRTGHNASIEVLARQPFGKNASVAVVVAAGKALVLGVTDQSVTMLAEADAGELMQPQQPEPETQWTGTPGATSPTFSWKAWIEQLRERTVRR